MPEKLRGLFLGAPARYKVAYGGRGGAKSHGVARCLVGLAMLRPIRVLCTREYQNSIGESVHRLLADQIDALGFARAFNVQANVIRGGKGSEFIFAGLKTNPTKIKSFEGIDIAWVEEADRVSNHSWQVLIPTVRKPGSEIWITFNPDLEEDPTYQRFVVKPPPSARVLKVGYRDNPWFPAELEAERLYLASVDDDAYRHVWGGEVRKNSNAQILRGKVLVEDFTGGGDGWDGPYFGADWGFSQDPSTLVKAWVVGRRLYVEHEAYGVGVDIDATPALFDRIPGARAHVIRADSARPETISYMQRNGYPSIRGVAKWAGSVEDGIGFLRSFEAIVVHPRCLNTIQETRLYSYKVDRLTGDVLADIVDQHNHLMDALRYALEPMIKRAGTGILEFYRIQTEAADAEKAAKNAAK